MAKEKNTRDMSLEELKSKLSDTKESLFNLRFQRSLQQLEKPENISKTNLLNKKQLEKNLKLNLTRKASYSHIIQLQMIRKQQEKN